MGLRGETAVKLINKWRNSTPHEILSGWFQSYGKLVGRYPIPFLLGTILLNCILSSGLYNLHEETDVKNVYIPTNAISLQENEALENYRNSKETTYTISTMFEGKSGKNLLTNASLSAILQITDYAENHLNVSYNNSYYDYRKLHDTGYSENLEVSGNGLLKVIKRLTTDPKLRHNNSNVQLKFPMIKAYGKKIFVPLVLLDVKSDEADVIQSASIVRIIYVLVQQTATSHLSKQEFLQTCHQFGRKFESYATELNLNHQTDFISYAFHLEVLQLEMAEVTHTTFPMLMASMAMLICFTVSVGISRSCVTTKAWESLAGVISALMAVTSSFGLLFHLGYPFMGTVVTVPFLILAIGNG